MMTGGENGSALTRSLGVRRVSPPSLPIHRGSAPPGYGMATAMCGSGYTILIHLIVIQCRGGAAPGPMMLGPPASPLATASIPRTSSRAFALWWPLFCRFLVAAFWLLGFHKFFSVIWYIMFYR